MILKNLLIGCQTLFVLNFLLCSLSFFANSKVVKFKERSLKVLIKIFGDWEKWRFINSVLTILYWFDSGFILFLYIFNIYFTCTKIFEFKLLQIWEFFQVRELFADFIKLLELSELFGLRQIRPSFNETWGSQHYIRR